MVKLDRTEQRIVGVLIEKQLSVPDTYPLSENALEAGCNQKNNRDPVTELEDFQIRGALMSLQEKGYAVRVEGGSRVAKFKHRIVEELHTDQKQLAVFAELLLRGPQAAGALKPRVARMGCHLSPEEIEAMLRTLAERKPPLVELLPLGPRERERRWRHLLGDGTEMHGLSPSGSPANERGAVVSAVAAVSVAPVPPRADASSDVERRLEALERQVAAMQDELRRLRSPEPRGSQQ